MFANRLQNFIFAALVGSTICSANATDNAPIPDYQRDTLTGNWHGLRSNLYQRGIAVEAGFKLDSFNNLNRGFGSASRSMSNLDLKLRADLEKLWGWEDGTAYFHLLDNRGAGINAREIGSLIGVSNIEVPVGTSRLFHAWIQQSFMAEQWSLLAGLYPVDSEFSVLDSASVFINPAYGVSADLALTRGPSIFNNSAAGMRVKWQASDRTRYGMLALLDGIPGDPAKPKGTHIKFGKHDGNFTIAEFGWMPIEQGHVFEPSDPGDILQPPELKLHEKHEGVAKYAIGAWRYSNKVDDQLAVDRLGNPKKRNSWGAYLLAEHSLWNLQGNPARQVNGLLRYAFTDGNSTPIKAQLNLGIAVRGLLATRPDDTFGLAWTTAGLAKKYRSSRQGNDGLNMAHAENAAELTYRISINHWLAIQPDLQWIHHSGGDAGARKARAAGIRFEILL
ncbi:carbohydrate porin [Azonexus sp.]|uniref:carbohydrate porin n=1 Tax=Azonexus sp. TaxID=1872668 RepID=UPI0027B89F7E|nr:carbohydrate porin [Azonexus sp.]